MENEGGAPSKSVKRPRMRIKIEDGVAKGVYSNNAVVQHNDTEFVLDFLFVEPPRSQGHVVSRIVTNPKAVKQLANGLSALIKRYEERFGEIEVPQGGPSVDPKGYH